LICELWSVTFDLWALICRIWSVWAIYMSEWATQLSELYIWLNELRSWVIDFFDWVEWERLFQMSWMRTAFPNELNENGFFNRFVLVSGHSASYARYQCLCSELRIIRFRYRFWAGAARTHIRKRQGTKKGQGRALEMK
jgi:hypothetical protein